jgi:iron(III) transport system ATP-binding protein
VSDRIIVMDAGRIAQQGTPQELYEAPASRFLADFIGDANLVDGELEGSGEASRFASGGVSVPVAADGLAPGPATLAVRPHNLQVVAAGQGMLDGVCRRVSYLGSRVEYVVATAWGELLAFDGDVRTRRTRDEPVGIAFERHGVILLPR